METLIESLPEDEQKQIDPALFTCCPNCKTSFKIPVPGEISKGLWRVQKTAVFYNGQQLKMAAGLCRVLFEIIRAPGPIKAEVLGYRVCGRDAGDYQNIAQVQICHLRNRLTSLDIPIPFMTIRHAGYKWTAE